jgi:hypothetical protein
MPSTSLRPLLRTSNHLPSPTPNYVCSQCRHARLLKRPKRPYTFTQLVTLSDGSAFTMRTTSPTPVYRSTRDTRNSPLWNPRTRELLNVEDDEAGRLAGFRARFGLGFDTAKGEPEETEAKTKEAKIDNKASQVGGMKELMETQGQDEKKGDGRKELRDMKVEETKREKQRLTQQAAEEEDEGWDFGEDDENMLDLISRFGQDEDIRQKDIQPVKKKK